MYVDVTNLSKLACIVNFCRNLGNVLEIISVSSIEHGGTSAMYIFMAMLTL